MGPEKIFVEARTHTQTVLESVRLQLLGVQLSLPEPAAEGLRLSQAQGVPAYPETEI